VTLNPKPKLKLPSLQGEKLQEIFKNNKLGLRSSPNYTTLPFSVEVFMCRVKALG
jgi:hypothetical protein